MSAGNDRHDEVLPPGAPASPAEHAEAESFARLVDRLVSGQELPPVMPSDERALVEVAAVVRACTGEPRLDESRRRALIDEALGRAMQARPRLALTTTASPAAAGLDAQASLEAPPAPSPEGRGSQGGAGRDPAALDVHGTRPRGRFQRFLPWTVAAISAAAALLLALREPAHTPLDRPGARLHAEVDTLHEVQARLQPIHRSRPADSLVGEIPRSRAAAATDRIDVIYADRLLGYRDLRLRGGRP